MNGEARQEGQDRRPRFNLGLSDARWIAAVTIVGYGLTFAYDSGFLGQFGVPAWVIRPDLPHVLSAVAGFSFAGMLVWGTAHSLPSRPYWTLIPLITGLGAAALMASFVVRYTNWTWGWQLIVPVALLIGSLLLGLTSVLEVVQAIVKFDQIPSRWDRLRKSQESRSKNPVDAVEKIVFADPTGQRMSWYVAMIVLLLTTLAARSCGGFSARRLNVVAFRAVPVPCIVIQHYGDQLVCASIDTATHMVGKSFSLIPVNDATILLEERSFWPLRFPEEEEVFVFGPGAYTKPEPARQRAIIPQPARVPPATQPR